MLLSYLKKTINALTSTRAAGMYFLLFAAAIGIATFIENDFGTSSAQDVIFKSHWFEALLVLFCLSITMNIIRYRMIPMKKWASLCFHSAIIIIVIGAAVTRYFSTEGMMHIREGESSQMYVSAEDFLKCQIILGDKTYSFAEPVLFSSLGNHQFKSSYQIENQVVDLEVTDIIPNPKEKITEDSNGVPVLKIVIAGNMGREEYFLKKGEQREWHGLLYNFSEAFIPGAFNVSYDGQNVQFVTQESINQRVMATQQVSDLAGGTPHPLMLRSLYTMGSASFVVGDFMPKGRVSMESEQAKITNESKVGVQITVSVQGKTQKTMLIGQKGDEGQPQSLDFGDMKMSLQYGAKVETLPFSILCKDFILERYPGTENPSSYASEVTLQDPAKAVQFDQRIYMNHILDYEGYRFFQSSFDQDELGTYLSVNHDFWGTWISYLGYFLLTIGLMMSFVDKKSRFSQLMAKLKESQNAALRVVMLGLGLSFSTLTFGQMTTAIPLEHATNFGKILVQDYNGRIKPMNSYNGELLRKIARSEHLFDQNADQIILSMIMNPATWEKTNLIFVPDNPEIKQILHIESNMASYASFFGADGKYLLQEQVSAAQAMIPKEQGTKEKALIKLDEKVNIVNMIFSGSIFRLFPNPSDSTHTWSSPADPNPDMQTMFSNYLHAVSEGVNSGDFQQANGFLSQISDLQKTENPDILPADEKVKAELFLNSLDVFNRLKGYYGILCLVLTGGFLYMTVKKSDKRARWTRIALYAMVLGFFFHTLGLGLRWYVSGRAPWSNGYESMIYIGWTTMLAGTLFSRKSLGGLAATATLAATILFVASMSWLDPEITPLVPVLKSYWLTIHVSLEAGSYGFLLLGAVLGMLNLVLMILMKPANKANTLRTIKELAIISEITLLGGLAMVSIGTYLGGVWANESWGRYWGWDAKETWALVTILVYSFILHMRFIPKLQGIFAFNFASLFGFATVIMTYLGVNYYLSGLHSYAAGDPVPMPPAVYYTTITLVILSGFAYRNFNKQMKS